jgi:hypothetical protein
MYCNLPGFDFIQGQSVRIYFMAFGSSADMHTPLFSWSPVSLFSCRFMYCNLPGLDFIQGQSVRIYFMFRICGSVQMFFLSPVSSCRFMYCNLPGLDFIQGQSVRIYFMAFGSSADMHTPNTAESQLFLDGHRKQAVALLPGAMLTTDTT